jgi:threonyl-tRNA synthetase
MLNLVCVIVTSARRYNYILVVGEEERSSNTVNSRTRDNVVHGTKSLDEIIAEFKIMAESFQA